MLLHVTAGAELPDLDGDSERLTELAAELLVAVGFCIAQVEVAMQRCAAEAQSMQDVQQGNAIGTAAEPHINLPRRKSNEIGYALKNLITK